MKKTGAQQPDSAMALALKAAGKLTPFERAKNVGREAWSKWSTIAGAGARRDYLRAALDAEMVLDAGERWRQGLTHALLTFILDAAAADMREDAEHKRETASLKRRRLVAKAPRLSQREIDRGREYDDQITARTKMRELNNALNVCANRIDEHDFTCAEAAANQAIQSQAADNARKEADRATDRLWTFKINGKPLAEHTAEEALIWCDQQERDVDFVRALCQGVPPKDQLSKWYGTAPIDVEAIWKSVNSQDYREKRRQARAHFEDAWEKAKRLALEIGPDGVRTLAEKAIEVEKHRRVMSGLIKTREAIAEFPDPFRIEDISHEG